MSTVTDVLSSAIRGVIVAPRGKKLVVADLAGIENRILAWLAGEEWKLQAFRDNLDLYKVAYAKAFGIPLTALDRITKDQRQIGKVKELMLGYQGGVGAYITGAATYRIDLEQMATVAWDSIPSLIVDEARDFLDWQRSKKGFTQFGLSDEAYLVCESFKRLWRYSNPKIASYWKEIEQACVDAVRYPGKTFTCRRHKIRRDGAWLRIMLPSGRALCYPSPEVDEGGKLSYMGINHYSRQWCRLRTYGGKLVENITQAAARDVLAANMQPIEDEGYEIVLTVHDEIISETPDEERYSCEHLAELMSTVPSWAEGLPLAAAGFEAYRYRKD
ncbi:hypothetical protein AAKU67_002239 [Oxalobacteraceae bacterium GrIS 2.11]